MKNGIPEKMKFVETKKLTGISSDEFDFVTYWKNTLSGVGLFRFKVSFCPKYATPSTWM